MPCLHWQGKPPNTNCWSKHDEKSADESGQFWLFIFPYLVGKWKENWKCLLGIFILATRFGLRHLRMTSETHYVKARSHRLSWRPTQRKANISFFILLSDKKFLSKPFPCEVEDVTTLGSFPAKLLKRLLFNWLTSCQFNIVIATVAEKRHVLWRSFREALEKSVDGFAVSGCLLVIFHCFRYLIR